MKKLHLGQASGGRFTFPAEAILQTFAILAVRGAGKTTTATVMAEEFCEANLPWICFDPVGVWYGLRSTPNGKPGGYPVLVIGGLHADYPLERTQGAALARALMADPVCAVIDLSQETKKFWHTFLTDFCLELLNLNPKMPRHIFIEEAPEFVPQRTKQDLTARCKEAIERLIRLGRNKGYGCTLISQRPATVDKDVLSQCENLIVMRTPGPHDRKALKEWIEAQASDKGLEKFLKSLAGLPHGTAYFWSPEWLNTFEKVKIRQRKTFHPGATRTLGKEIKEAKLCPVDKFVGQLKRTIKTVSKEPPPQARRGASALKHDRIPSAPSDGTVDSETEFMIKQMLDGTDQSLIANDVLAGMKKKIGTSEARAVDAERRLQAVRKFLKPEYDNLLTLFGKLGSADNGAGSVNMEVWEPWLKKAGRRGAKKMLEVLLENTGKTLTRNQLGTLSGVTHKKSTFRQYLSWLRKNGLIKTEGDTVELLNP